jgi:putative cyclase
MGEVPLQADRTAGRERAMCTEKCLELPRGSTVSRRTAMVGAAAVAASAALGGTAQAGEREPAFRGARHGLRDLTHPLTTSFPPCSLGEEPVRETVATIEVDGYYMQKWEIIEHIGTHVDAPGHFTPGGRLAPDLKPSELIVPAVVVNVAAYRGVDAEGSCTSPGSGPRPPSGCCAAGGSAPSASTPSASTPASPRPSTPT